MMFGSLEFKSVGIAVRFLGRGLDLTLILPVGYTWREVYLVQGSGITRHNSFDALLCDVSLALDPARGFSGLPVL